MWMGKDKKEGASLTAYKNYGDNALEIYEECSTIFGWNRNNSFEFDGSHQWYASKTTLEGYDVWVLFHNNWTGTRTPHWINELSEDEETIVERCFNPDFRFWAETYELRLVFARNKAGEFLFLGLYKVESIDNGKKIKTYRRISREYHI